MGVVVPRALVSVEMSEIRSLDELRGDPIEELEVWEKDDVVPSNGVHEKLMVFGTPSWIGMRFELARTKETRRKRPKNLLFMR